MISLSGQGEFLSETKTITISYLNFDTEYLHSSSSVLLSLYTHAYQVYDLCINTHFLLGIQVHVTLD